MNRRTWTITGDDAGLVLTRDELVDELKRRGFNVTARNIIYWQTKGIIPYPIRRRYNGATRAIYPYSAIETITQLRELQKRRYKLREIAPVLRGAVNRADLVEAIHPGEV